MKFVSVLCPLALSLPSLAMADAPGDMPGCVLWLDGDDVDGDGVSGGDLVGGTTWVDRSATGADAVQIAVLRQPEVVANAWNGRSVVRFDGSRFMDVEPSGFGMLSGVTGATLFAVASTSVTDTNQRVVMVSSGANAGATRAGLALFDQFGTSIAGSGDFGAAGRRLDTDSFQRLEGGTISVGALEHYSATFNYSAGEVSLHVAGNLEALATHFQTPGATSPTDSLNIRLGADAALNALRGEFTGDLAEVIVFDRVLSDTERQSVAQYLETKWFGAPIGQPYCGPAAVNSSGSSGTIRAVGSNAAATNNVTLIAENIAQNAFGYFVTSQTSAFVVMPGGSQGNLCVGGDVGRYIADVASSGDGGCLTLSIDLTAIPQPTGSAAVAPGDTWNFQAWFRDSAAGSATSNFTDALAISFL